MADPTPMSDEDFAAVEASLTAAQTDFGTKELARLAAREALAVQRTAYGVVEASATTARTTRDGLIESVRVQKELRAAKT